MRRRSVWTISRDFSLEIQFDEPVREAILPSHVMAHLAWT